jgi:hypothetical protein
LAGHVWHGMVWVPPRSVLDLRDSADMVSPLAPSVSQKLLAAFQSCLAAAVRGPERFLGRICSYGACPVNDWEDSPATVRKAMKMWGDSAHKLQDNSVRAKSEALV